MKKGLKVLLIIVAILVVAGIALGSSYNGLVAKEEGINNAYANIQTQMQRRNDLIPNLVNTVKGYAQHENEVFTAVTEAREKMMSAQTPNDTAQADGELTQALGRLIAVAEAYPELKANENFLSLQDELAGTENRIAVARKDYNDTILPYNTKIRSFPTNILAGMFGFEKKDMFEASSEAQSAPNVSFN